MLIDKSNRLAATTASRDDLEPGRVLVDLFLLPVRGIRDYDVQWLGGGPFFHDTSMRLV
jgi:hypothetical protein